MSIYILTHKVFQQTNDPYYKSLLVGAYRGHIFGDYYDDVGTDNISRKNENYCELTGIYWLWKYCKDDIIGINHYRRYFSKSLNSHKILSKSDINRKLKKNDIIVPNITEIYQSLANQFLNSFEPWVLNEVKESIQRISPECLSSYSSVMNNNKVYYCNMMICRRDLFQKYCEWLFPILFDLEKHIDISIFDDYQKRIYGFVSERLLTVWIFHSKLKVCELGMINTESQESNLISFCNGIRRVYSYYFPKNQVAEKIIKFARNIKHKKKLR